MVLALRAVLQAKAAGIQLGLVMGLCAQVHGVFVSGLLAVYGFVECSMPARAVGFNLAILKTTFSGAGSRGQSGRQTIDGPGFFRQPSVRNGVPRMRGR